MALILQRKRQMFIVMFLLASCLLTFVIVNQVRIVSGAWIVWFIFLFCALQTGRFAWEFEVKQTQRPEIVRLSHPRWVLRCVLLNIFYLVVAGLLPFAILGLGLFILNAQIYPWPRLVLVALVLVLPTAVVCGVIAGVFNSWLLRLDVDFSAQ